MRDECAFILRFWFEDTPPSKWFQHDPSFDARLIELFDPVYKHALGGVYDDWGRMPDGALALILLFDQFPRNMFRGSARMYETDSRARAIARAGVAAGFDQVMPVMRRRFFYLPFEHSEDQADQDISIRLFAGIRADDPVGYNYAERHFAVIDRFGRFPHRNAVLGRASTADEIDFLAANPAGF